MKFLADENFPKRSIELLREQNIDISSIQEHSSGVSDIKVLKIAMKESRTILPLDSDFGTLLFKLDMKPKEGVIFFRLVEFDPFDLYKILLELIERNENFENSLVVIDKNSIRRRKY